MRILDDKIFINFYFQFSNKKNQANREKTISQTTVCEPNNVNYGRSLKSKTYNIDSG